MPDLTQVKDHPQSKSSFWFPTIIASLGGFLVGYENGIINQIFDMESFDLYFGVSSSFEGWISFSFLIGCSVGAILSSYPADRFGRRTTMQIGAVIFLIGAILQSTALSIGQLHSGRVFSGISIGLMSSVCPLYLSEIAETHVRGRITCIYQLMITIGIFTASCVNSLIIEYFSPSNKNYKWRLAFGLQMGPCMVMMICLFLLPRSPRWLLSKNRKDHAMKALSRLRASRDGLDVRIEYETMRLSVEAELIRGKVTWIQLFSKGTRRRVFIASALQFFQQWTGINTVVFYGSSLFARLGFSDFYSSIAFVLVYSLVNVLATLPALILIEKLGRRPLLIIGGFTMSFCHLMLAISGILFNKSDQFSWVFISFGLLFMISFAMTWGAVPWIYQSEIFPTSYRAKGSSIATTTNWIWNAAIAKSAPLIFSEISYWGYIIFGVMCFVMALFSKYFVPETKGKILEDMDQLFGSAFNKYDIDYMSYGTMGSSSSSIISRPVSSINDEIDETL